MKRLVDPFNFTKFDRTVPELEAMILFSIMVANKRADQTYRKLEEFLAIGSPFYGRTPFAKVRSMIHKDSLRYVLELVRAGQYERIERAFRGVLDLDLKTCTVEDLEAVHGIGPKTARMFLLHSRPHQRLAVLDTHLLAYLAEVGVQDVPRSTPPAGNVYARLEREFLRVADSVGRSPAELDLAIWEMRTLSSAAPR